MNLSIPLIATKTGSHLGQLKYLERDLPNTQRRFVDRYALEPEISLDDLSCRAVIDWINVRFFLRRETQHQWIRQDLMEVLNRNMFVKAVDPKPGKVSNTFDIKFQEPEPTDIISVRSALSRKYGLELEETVEGIEISVDFKPKFPDDVLRAKTHTMLTRHFVTATDLFTNFRDRPRFNYGRQKWQTEGLIFGRELKPTLNDESFKSTDRDRAPYVDSSYYLGAREGNRMWRIMDKVIDRQNPARGAFLRLDDASKRVRIEVTLKGHELASLGITRVEDLKRVSFSQLQGEFFKFMLPTFAKTANMVPGRGAAIQAWRDRQRIAKFLMTGVIGLRAMDQAMERQSRMMRRGNKMDMKSRGLNLKAIERKGRGKFGTFVAYKGLNEKVERALRHLGERVAVWSF